MSTSARALWPVVLLVVAVAGTGGALAASDAPQGDAAVTPDEEDGPDLSDDELILDFTPAEATVQPGENATYDVVARGTSLGISAYSEVVIDVEDSDVAEIVDFDTSVPSGALDSTEFLDDGGLSLGAALLGNPFSPKPNVTLATVTVAASETSDKSTTLTYREDARQSFAGPGDRGYEIAETRDATLSVREETPAQFGLPTLDPGDTTVLPGETTDISAVVTNDGDREATQTVELVVGETTETQSVSLAPGETKTVVFEDVGRGLEPGEYTYSVSTANATREATLSVSGPPPLDENGGKPADPDGDGLYEDVRGSGDVSILDVQALFNGLDTQTLAENTPAFNFQDQDSEVNILDVQALFTQLP
jgi:plastocyanin